MFGLAAAPDRVIAVPSESPSILSSGPVSRLSPPAKWQVGT